MIVYKLHILWKYKLIAVVDRYREIGPPHKGLRRLGRVVYPHLKLDVGAPWANRHTRDGSGSGEGLGLPHPDGFFTVFPLFQNCFHR